MTSNVRTQSITNGQIGQINDRLATRLRESGLSSDGVQKALRLPGGAIIDEMVAVFRKHVEVQDRIIIRHVKVDRSRTPQQVIDATGRYQYIENDVLATMPTGEGDEVDVYFVPIERCILVAEAPAFLAQYGLVSDPRAQAAVNEMDPAFADKYLNGTQWGGNCYLTFHHWLGERSVCCNRNGANWFNGWFLSGVLPIK